MAYHFPVLSQEVIDLLSPADHKIFIDATLGNGGHTQMLLEKGSKVYGIEADPANLKLTEDRIQSLGLDDKFTSIHANFSDLKDIWEEHIKTKVDGVLFDLGLSSNQQTASDRGFSFNDPNSLDMRLDPQKQTLTAEYVVNVYPFDELYKIFTYYAQEKYAKPIILRLIRKRQQSPLKTGTQLAEIIRNYYTEKKINSKIDPATKIFMALRIFVNDEYENIKKALTESIQITKPGGVVAVITFHSGEDRIVKQFIKTNTLQGSITALPKIQPSPSEIVSNHLSRSALLRSFRIN